MTDEVGWAALGVRPDFTGFPSALSRGVSGPMERAGRDGGNRLVTGLRSSVRHGVSSIVAPLAGAFAAYKVVDFFKDSVSEARESQKVTALTTVLLANQGDQATTTAGKVGALSRALAHKAGLDDELVQSGANVLLGFRQIRNEAGKGSKVFDRATTDATDLAAALAAPTGGTPNVAAAAKLVGRALADPEKGMTRLSRVVGDFTADQQASVKAFLAQGDAVSAQKVILQGLEDRYAGVARSQRTTGDQVTASIANIKESIGTGLLPALDAVEGWFLHGGTPLIRHWVRDFEHDGVPAIRHFAGAIRDDGLPMLKGLVDEGQPLAESMLPAIAATSGIMADAFKTAAPYAKSMVDAFNDAPEWVQKGTVFATLGLLAGKKFNLFSGGKSLLGAITPTKPLPVYVVNGGGLGTGVPGAPTTGLPGSASKGKPTLPLLGPPILPGVFPDGPTGVIDKKDLLPSSVFAQMIADRKAAAALQGQLDKANTGGLSELLLGQPGTQDALKTFLTLDTTKADAKLKTFRNKAGQPITIEVAIERVAKNLGDTVTSALDDLVGASSGRHGGLTVQGDLNVQAQDYRDLQRQLQQRTQQANLGGRPPGA